MSAPFNGAKALLDADSGDIHILMLGDSTGETFTEWVGYFMYLLHYYYPSFAVSYSEWYNGGTYSWTTPSTTYSGSGSNTVHIWCAGGGGYGCDEFTSQEAAIIQHPTDVDFCTIALGHNTTRGESDFNALVEMVEDNWPSAHITMVVQNPRYDDFSLGATTAATVATVASTYDTGLVDIRARFLNDPDPQTNLMGDNVHPNDLGRRVWGETTWLSFYPDGGWPLATLDDAVFLVQAKNYSGSGDWLDEVGSVNGTITDAVFSEGDGVLSQPHFYFDGSGDKITFAQNSVFDIGANASKTILAGITVDTPTDNRVLIDQGGFSGASVGGWALDYFGTSSVRVSAAEQGVGAATDTHQTNMVADTLHVVGLVRDHIAEDLLAYLDGVASSGPSAVSGSSDRSSTIGVAVGVRSSTQNYAWHRGRVTFIAIWDVRLSDTEIASLGAQLAGTGKSRISTVFAPVARW